jgi:CDP-diacylglycerol--glycerol-3-phosphate 3-phosphatidyltransferase
VTPEQHLLRWQELHGTEASPLVRRWLAVVLRLGRPLAATGVHPHVITALGPAVLVVALGLPAWAAAPLVLVSGLLDGLDGCVAVLQDRVTALGGVLDRAADRAGEVLLAALLVGAGVPVPLALGCLGGMLLLELLRFLAGRVGTVTVAERPVRLLFTAAGLLTWPEAWTWALTALTAVGIGQLGVALRRPDRERTVTR